MDKRQETTDSYVNNEVSANRHMSYVLLFTAGLLLLVLVGYLSKLFYVSQNTFVMTVITLPIVALFLCSPMLYIKTDRLRKPNYKYYVLFLFVFAIGVLNVIMPKHGVLGWAVCIALTAHYYNPKVCKIMFATVLVSMLVCISLGMFYGEFDAYLLSGDLNEEQQVIKNYLLPVDYPDTPSGRWDYLSALIKVGENRFLKVFLNYYVGRALFVTLLFAVIVFLNKRTQALLTSEINANSEFEKNKTELDVASGIQLNTLPAEAVSSQDVEILAELKPAKEVGGDLYDYCDIDEDHVAVLIGDVSGKGVPAAMFMMKTITSFRDFATANRTPSRILQKINASVYQGNKAGMFVTCFLAILDKRDGSVVFANAGHNRPLVGSNGNFRYLKCKSGFLLGAFENAMVQDEYLTLAPGEGLILYTDGITEARNDAGEFFGEARLLELANRRDYASVIDLHHALKEEVAAFVLDAPQSDDITTVALKYLGGGHSYMEKEFQAKMENVPAMLDAIEDFSRKNEFPDGFMNQLLIVGDEIFSNIVNHGYGNAGGPINLKLLFDKAKNEFVLTVIDESKAFNPLTNENPEAGTAKGLTHIGGLGIHIVKKIMTEYAYDRVNEKNILVLKKRF